MANNVNVPMSPKEREDLGRLATEEDRSLAAQLRFCFSHYLAKKKAEKSLALIKSTKGK